MAMATQEALAVTRFLLFLIITVVIVTTPALAGHSSPPSTLTVYAFQSYVPPDATAVVVASPSGNFSTVEFGTSTITSSPLQETEAADSPSLGVVVGQLIVTKDLSLYGTVTFLLNTTSFAGSISVQGSADPLRGGELAITGGTYDFRWARGYAEVALVSQSPTLSLFKVVFHIRYD